MSLSSLSSIFSLGLNFTVKLAIENTYFVVKLVPTRQNVIVYKRSGLIYVYRLVKTKYGLRTTIYELGRDYRQECKMLTSDELGVKYKTQFLKCQLCVLVIETTHKGRFQAFNDLCGRLNTKRFLHKN